MAKPKAEQRLMTVSTEYIGSGLKQAEQEIYSEIGGEDDWGWKVNGVLVEVLKKHFMHGSAKILGVKLSTGQPHSILHRTRKVMVKDGHLDLAQVDRKIAELVALKAADEERSGIQKAERDRATAAKQAAKSEAEAAGLSFQYYGLGQRPIVSWILQDDLGLAVAMHWGLLIEQAVQVQKLIESFNQESKNAEIIGSDRRIRDRARP
jgi:hypothetical protein